MKGCSGLRAGSRQNVNVICTSRSRLLRSHTVTPQQQLQQQLGSVSPSLLHSWLPTGADSSRCSLVFQAAATAVAPAAAVGAVPRGETAGAVLVLEDVTVQVRQPNTQYSSNVQSILLDVKAADLMRSSICSSCLACSASMQRCQASSLNTQACFASQYH
jgi:hypothetical protein